jgi:predicted TPR repeat methyltransferase
VFDIGCGTGLVAGRLRRVLGPDGKYEGVDQVANAVEQARQRLHGDPRFRCDVGDAEHAQVTRGSDLVLFNWVMNWLDTHSVDRIFRRLGKLPPQTTLITCVAFLACVRSRNGSPIGGSRHYAAARDYLKGKRGDAEALWDISRYESYRHSLLDNFRIIEEHVRPGANIFWVAKPKRLR